MSKHLSDLQFLLVFLTAKYFSVLGCYHSLLSALFDRYIMALEFPISWSLQGNQCFITTVSHNIFSRPLHKDILDIQVKWPKYLSLAVEEDPKTPSLIQKTEPQRQSRQIVFVPMLECGTLIQLHLQQFSGFDGFIHSMSLDVIQTTTTYLVSIQVGL